MSGILIASAISGCGGTKQGDNGVKTVTIWSGNTHMKTVVEPLINNWNNNEGKEKGIFIDYQFKDGGTITQAIDTALQSGEAPDMFSTGNVRKLSETGNILAIEDLPGGKEYIEQYCDKKFFVEGKNIYKGKTYGLPICAGPQGLIYNKDMFKKAGLVDENGEPTPPETWDEVREYAKILTNASEKRYGIILPMKWTGWFNSDVIHAGLASVGHMGFDPTVGKYDYSGFAPIADCLLGMKADGSVYPGSETIDNDPARALFASGVVGMKLAYCFDVGVLNDQFPAECDWGVAPYPVLDKDNKYMQRMTYSNTMRINSKALDTVGGDAMMEVVKLFTSDWWIKEMYKGGVDLPHDPKYIEGVELGDSAKKGWTDFADLLDISAQEPREPMKEMGDALTLQDKFINEVWSGEKTSAQMFEEYSEQTNEGVATYYKNHPEESLDEYINKDWNIKRD